jgi:hypothetical protein
MKIGTSRRNTSKVFKTSPWILLPLTDSYRNFVIARNEAILMRTLIAIVVRLLRRLKKPSRNDDFSRPITAKILILYNKLSLRMTKLYL